MGNSARRPGARLRGLAVTAACVTAALVLGGCASGSAAGAPDGTAATQAPAQASAQGSTRQPAACNADYCDPADWDTARATTPLSQIPPFVEPLSVVISARSTLPLTDIKQALSQWKTVSTATTVNITGIHLKCISSEQADVAGGGYVPQNVAWRVRGRQRPFARRQRGPRADMEPAGARQSVRRVVHRGQLRDPVPGKERRAANGEHGQALRGAAPKRRLPLRRRRAWQ